MRLPRRADAGNALTNIGVTVSGWGKISDGIFMISLRKYTM